MAHSTLYFLQLERSPAMLISVSGIDCSGKTTLGFALAKALDGFILQFPDRTTPSGLCIDEALRLTTRLPAAALASLFATNRMEQLEALMLGKGSPDHHVICVRYTPDACAYGVMEGLDRQWLRDIDRGVPAPDVAVLLQVEPDLAHERLRARPTRERYERSVPQLLHAACELDNVWPRNQIPSSQGFYGMRDGTRWLKYTGDAATETGAVVQDVVSVVRQPT